MKKRTLAEQIADTRAACNEFIDQKVRDMQIETPQVPAQSIRGFLLKGDSLIDATSRLLEERHVLA